MGLGNVFGRVLQWLANEVIVKSLSESPAFQRFAVRSSEQAKQMSKSASEAVRTIAESENVTSLKKVQYSGVVSLKFVGFCYAPDPKLKDCVVFVLLTAVPRSNYVRC